MSKATDPLTTALRRAALVDIGLELAAELGTDRLVQKFCRAAQDVIGAKYASVHVLDESGQRLRHSFVTGLPGDWGANRGIQPLRSGILGALLASKRSHRLRDLSGNPQELGLPPEHPPVQTFLGVPVATTKDTSGWLYLFEKSGADEFSEEDQHLAETLASQFAVAYENARLRERLQSSLQETSVVNEVARIITSTLDIGQVYERFAKEAKKLVDFDRIALNVINRDEGTFTFKYVAGLIVAGHKVGDTMALAGSQVEKALLIGRSQARDDIDPARDLHVVPEMVRSGVRSSIIVPLVGKGQVIGGLSLWSLRKGTYGPREQIALENLANQIASALENATLYEQVQRHTTELEQHIIVLQQAEESIQLQARMLDQVGQAVIATDVNSNITYWNRAAETNYGWLDAEALGRNVLDLIVPDVAKQQVVDIISRVATGETWSGESAGLRRDRKIFPIFLTVSPIRGDDGQLAGLIGVSTDIAERRNLEDQLRQTQKMDTVGRLAGGVAHDFNNLLTAILGFTQLGIAELPADHRVAEYLKQVQDAAQRAANFTKQLMQFSRHQAVESKVVNLSDVILDTTGMLRRLITEDIELAVLLTSDPTPVKADPGNLQQLLMNLVVNARDAMPQGGKITIQTSRPAMDSVEDMQYTMGSKDQVVLSVSDTGVGMTQEVKAHLFEPFFTTKPKGQGTGLGLATCYGIVQRSGGHIEVESEPGVGTFFRIYFPAAETSEAISPERYVVDSSLRGSETVIVAEDEPLVRMMISRVLQGQGYSVLEAGNGEEALRVAEDHPGEKIHLLLTDMVMPHMGGAELARRFQAIWPDTRVLFTSGYSEDPFLGGGVASGEVEFIQKPYMPSALARKVREVLDKART